jgi:hypothetical protein
MVFPRSSPQSRYITQQHSQRTPGGVQRKLYGFRQLEKLYEYNIKRWNVYIRVYQVQQFKCSKCIYHRNKCFLGKLANQIDAYFFRIYSLSLSQSSKEY